MCIRDSTHTHTHTHTQFALFWPHSCLFSYICTLFKWKVPKPTPTDVYKRQVQVSSVKPGAKFNKVSILSGERIRKLYIKQDKIQNENNVNLISINLEKNK